jgi:DNA primase
VCKKSWDVVSFIRDMEQLTFKEALYHLINVYKIDISSIPDAPELGLKYPSFSNQNIFIRAVEENLLSLRKKIPFEKYRALCIVFFL